MIEAIYKVGPLTWPEVFQCDNGSEFKASVRTLLEKHHVKVNTATTAYKHTHTAFVEALNKALAKRLFKAQDAQELNNPKMTATMLVKSLYKVVEQMNHRKTAMIAMKPAYLKEKLLPEVGL